MKAVKLTSAQNPKIKFASGLRDRKNRENERLTLLEGYRELTRAFEFGMKLREAYYSGELFLGENELPLLERLAAEGVEIYETTPQIIAKLAYRDRPEGLLAVAETRDHRLENMPFQKDGVYLVAEAVEKPGNLGSILRDADGAGVAGVIVCDKKTDIYNPNVIRASTGALFSVPLAEASPDEAFAWLKSRGARILAATPHTDHVYTEADLSRGALAIAVGAEQYGLSRFWLDKADLPVRIPMLGKIDSLNVSTAAALLLFEAARQRNWRRAS